MRAFHRITFVILCLTHAAVCNAAKSEISIYQVALDAVLRSQLPLPFEKGRPHLVVVRDFADPILPMPCRSYLSPELLRNLLSPRLNPPAIPTWSEKGLSFATSARIDQLIASVPFDPKRLGPYWTAGLEKAFPGFGGLVSFAAPAVASTGQTAAVSLTIGVENPVMDRYLVMLRHTDRWRADSVIRVSDAPDGVNGVSECAGRTETPVAAASVDAVDDSAINVYVYLAESHDAAVGAKVFVLGSNDCVLASMTADSGGVAHFPAALDRQNAKYVIAELETEFNFMLLTGVRWRVGRREYNLPLRAEPMVNRGTVYAH